MRLTLADRLNDLLHWMHHVEYLDVVEANVVRSNNGDGYNLYVDHLRVKDASRVRTSRMKIELNEVDIPSVEDRTRGINSVTLRYRREITSFCGWIFEDRPVLEKTIIYEDGREEGPKEISYHSTR